MEPPGTLRTERLVLRRATIGDAEDVYRYASDPEVTRFIGITPRDSLEQVEEYLDHADKAWDEGTAYTFAITTQHDGPVVGMIDCDVTDRGVSIGYALERAAWGRGYATEAARAVVEWAFTNDGVYRVWTSVAVDNTASQRVLEKAGMTNEGLLHRWLPTPNVAAEPSDAYIYARWR